MSEDLVGLVQLLDTVSRTNRLSTYTPYDWQKKFHDAGHDYVERMLMAANRVGKTMSAGAETAIHLTGLYPDWWGGRRLANPVLWWTGSPTNEKTRDIVPKELLGGVGEQLGTGWVPKHLIVGKPTMRQCSVSGVVETFKVRHVSGGLSTCMMKTYEQGWQKWQGTAPHGIWDDEEPDDYRIFSESQTRIMTTNGLILVTFTPLLGATELVEHFQAGGPDIFVMSATWDDAPHLDEKTKESLRSRYRAHELEARSMGIPMLGEGAIFPIADESISCDIFKIPDFWARIKGCDFGIDHPAAGVEIAWDRDQDVIYLINCYKQADRTAAYHAAWFNKTNSRIPVAWPHDGDNREKGGGGKRIKESYRDHGVNMLPKSACYAKAPGEKREKQGAQPVEPIVEEMQERMLTNRFKVFRHLSEFFDEKRNYHRKDGRIVPRKDDILKALFYAVMMRRYAVSLNSLKRAGRSVSNATRPGVTTA